MSSNLDFIAKWDIEHFQRRCVRQRALAERFPAYDRQMSGVEEYHWRVGPWGLGFMLETWERKPLEDDPLPPGPLWHGDVMIREETDYRTIDVHRRIEVPQFHLLSIQEWEPTHYEQAKFLLAEMFGPILRSGDQHQGALQILGSTAMHWYVRHEGPVRSGRFEH